MSADLDLGVGEEAVVRQRQVLRGRTFADATRGVVLRAVAGAEPAAEIALAEVRDAAEVGADADQYQPLRLAGLVSAFVGRRVAQVRMVGGDRLGDLLGRAVA